MQVSTPIKKKLKNTVVGKNGAKHFGVGDHFKISRSQMAPGKKS